MNEENHWQEKPDSGITSGPEEALRRETEKAKALKVERLQLRNEVESLRSENHRLREENRRLKEKLPLSERIDATVSNSKSEPEVIALSSLPASLRNGLLLLVFVISLLFYYIFGR